MTGFLNTEDEVVPGNMGVERWLFAGLRKTLQHLVEIQRVLL
jgi:hypothetical protein